MSWIPIEDFRGEPDSTVFLWWWGPEIGLRGDEALLGEDGAIRIKMGCGMSYCTHVMVADLPPPPATEEAFAPAGWAHLTNVR